MTSSPSSSGAASQQPLRIAAGALSPPITSTAARKGYLLPEIKLSRLLIDLQRELGVDVPAIVAGAVRQLGVAALWAAHVVDRLEGLMRSTLALAALGMFLDREHR